MENFSVKAEILDENAVSRAITRISFEIIERSRGADNLCLVGLYSRGAVLAKRIAAKIAENVGGDIPTGMLDITPFRDDERRRGADDASRIDFDITGKHVVIIDDVIFTGRTARAAMDALMSRGRPKVIQLAVLIDRGHRELPFKADYIGKSIPTSRNETVSVKVDCIDGETGVDLITD
ncbi:MAG TPA: bifunctional pyr operon transcriptional regulator/uracil phosphoribosyltransferase PyrR [Ruminococcaceae bacterium]|nr:bifunctional pyr operon transcriptional regulator/uracil phosphoribosyltransferase PyrR [Oscillospiraceae bacterium]